MPKSRAFTPLKRSSLMGFTLIELATVIAVLSIILGITIVAWRNLLPRYKLSQETSKIAEDLKYAQQKTVTEQISYLINFNQSDNSYNLSRLLPDGANPGSYIEETVFTKNFEAGIYINAINDLVEPKIQFTAAGGVVDSGSIELKNPHGDIRLIDIRPAGFINY